MSRRIRSAAIAAGAVAAFTCCAWLAAAHGQSRRDARLDAPPTAEFHFARLVYRNSPYSRRGFYGRRGGGAWATDYADAEFHVMQGISRLTRIDAAPVDIDGNGGRLIQLVDERTRGFMPSRSVNGISTSRKRSCCASTSTAAGS